MKIAIFGGSFNPVHLGHVALAVHCIEALQLDKLFVIPANASPFKEGSHYAPAIDRLKMCQLAFRGVPKTRVLPLELIRPGPSYTIDTLHELEQKKRISSKDELFLILGQDAVDGLKDWKLSDELMAKVTPVVVARSGEIAKKPFKNILFVDMPLFDVSATEIRSRVQKGAYFGHLVQKNIYTYIQKHRLYL
jgi:nicotinate-nucleotide adenylyltransferase